MPKRKSTPTKRKPIRKIRRKPAKQLHLWRYLLAGAVTCIIMWALIHEPKQAPQDLEQITENQLAKKASSKTRQGKEQTKANSASQDSQPSSVNDEVIQPVVPKTVKAAPVPKPGENEIDLVIRSTAEKLGVPESATKRRKKEQLVTFSIPIDRSQMDLTYANMIFKGELERNGATLLKGTDSRSKQSLSFYRKSMPETYTLDLYYDSKPYSNKESTKTITIVVDDFGAIGGSLLDGFLELDTEVVFAIFPDEPNSVETMKRATRQGRETIIHVPMEPIGYPSVNPGKNAILVQNSEAQIDRLLTKFIHQLPDCKGINNHMGSLATTDSDVMQAVMNTLKKHSKYFLDSRTTNVSVAYPVAQKAHLRAFRNDIFLDSPNISQSNMDAKLSQIIQLSQSKSNIIAITHCHNKEKLDYLKSFINRLKNAGFRLIPLSEVGEYKVPEIL